MMMDVMMMENNADRVEREKSEISQSGRRPFLHLLLSICMHVCTLPSNMQRCRPKLYRQEVQRQLGSNISAGVTEIVTVDQASGVRLVTLPYSSVHSLQACQLRRRKM